MITRRNGVAVLMSIELILNAANINFIAFSRFSGMDLSGHIFSLFVIILAAAEAAVALAIILNIFNNFGSINIDEALMNAANIKSGEKVHVVNINNGERTINYADAVILCTGGHTRLWEQSSSRKFSLSLLS